MVVATCCFYQCGGREYPLCFISFPSKNPPIFSSVHFTFLILRFLPLHFLKIRNYRRLIEGVGDGKRIIYDLFYIYSPLD